MSSDGKSNRWFGDPMGQPEIEFDLSIDFCVWVLEVDGLRVGPFDRHGAGDRRLRQLGLEADGWTQWTAQVVNAHWEKKRLIRRALQTAPEPTVGEAGPFEPAFTRKEGSFLRSMADPSNLWSGDDSIRVELARLWDFYLPMFHKRRTFGDSEITDLSDFTPSPRAETQLLDLASRYRKPDVYPRIYYVDYPGPLHYCVPPVSIILGMRRLTAGSKGVGAHLAYGLEELMEM